MYEAPGKSHSPVFFSSVVCKTASQCSLLDAETSRNSSSDRTGRSTNAILSKNKCDIYLIQANFGTINHMPDSNVHNQGSRGTDIAFVATAFYQENTAVIIFSTLVSSGKLSNFPIHASHIWKVLGPPAPNLQNPSNTSSSSRTQQMKNNGSLTSGGLSPL